MKNARYTLIYKFFATQIQFGYYKTGDFLPPSRICVKFITPPAARCVAPISSCRRMGTSPSPPAEERQSSIRPQLRSAPGAAGAIILARMEAAPALNEAMKLLLLPVMRNGCERLTPQAMSEIREMAAKLGDGDFYISFFGGYAMVMASENQLASALFSEVVSFYQFPHVLLRFAGKELEVGSFRSYPPG